MTSIGLEERWRAGLLRLARQMRRRRLGPLGRTVARGEIASLAHEARDYSVEARSSIAEAWLSGTQLLEIVRRLWRDVVFQLDLDGHLQVHDWVGWIRLAERRAVGSIDCRVDSGRGAGLLDGVNSDLEVQVFACGQSAQSQYAQRIGGDLSGERRTSSAPASG
jgi:hypothetical protein